MCPALNGGRKRIALTKGETSAERILAAAKAEFLKLGFEKASIRAIAAQVGMTSAGLYRHFRNKEEMFSALVEPTIAECTARFETEKANDYALLAKDQLEEMWSNSSGLAMLLNVIYENFDAFKLLLCCSEGTKYADFTHEFVSMEQQETLAYLEAARAKGIPVNDVKPEEMHLLLSAYSAAVFEIVVHDFTKTEAEHYAQTLITFFVPGWRAVLGI